METEAQKPQNQKNYENCPKHIESPVLIPEQLTEYMMTGGSVESLRKIAHVREGATRNRLDQF
jgi:hypothetical protein